MGPDGAQPPELAAAERLDEILAEFAAYPQPVVQDRVVELLRCVDAIHRPGLLRLADLLETAGLLGAALGDPPARLLLGLYGLDRGADDVHAADDVDEDEAHLETARPAPGLEQSAPDAGHSAGREGAAPVVAPPSGRPSPRAGPGWQELPVVEGVASGRPPQPALGGFVPLTSVRIKRPPRLEWRAAFRADRLPPGELDAVDVDGAYVLVANLDGELRAYRDACPGSPLPLHGGTVTGTILECPWHHCRYDLRDGSRLGGSGAGLVALPVTVEAGAVRIGIAQSGDGSMQEPSR